MRSDAVVLVIAVLMAQSITIDAEFDVDFGWAADGFSWLFGGVVVMTWIALLAAEGVWDTWTLANLSAEVRRILVASLMVFAWVGIFGFLADTGFARTYLLISAPLGIAGLLVNHWRWRRRLISFRRAAGGQHGVVVLGDLASADILCSDLREHLDSRFEVNGVWQLRRQDYGSSETAVHPDQVGVDKVSLVARDEVGGRNSLQAGAGLPVFGGHPLRVGRTSALVAPTRAEPGAVVVAAAPVLGPDRPPVPTLSVRQLRAKRALDLTFSGIGILLMSPVLLVVAAMVILADGGPVLHQQECVGRGGKMFSRWAFRCIPYGAKARPAVDDAPSGSTLSGSARRVEYDVATTSIGRLLRRTGLACAPGMLNVLAGQMSVVGPDTVSAGDITAHHPVTVRPGLTGLWRLSESFGGEAGIDARYVENWSLGSDLKIIGRSMKLAVTGKLPC